MCSTNNPCSMYISEIHISIVTSNFAADALKYYFFLDKFAVDSMVVLIRSSEF